jgi:hypothetical protein
MGRRAIELHHLRKIHFGNDHGVGGVEDRWIFERFVLSFCDGEKNSTRILAQIVTRRAH